MFDLEKLSWLVVGVAVGGGMYGSYIKLFGKNTIIQVNAYVSVMECASLLSSRNKEKIQCFISEYEKNKIKIRKSDAIVSGVATVINHKTIGSGMGVPLESCVNNLKKHLNSRY